jgi:hypothetical protein
MTLQVLFRSENSRLVCRIGVRARQRDSTCVQRAASSSTRVLGGSRRIRSTGWASLRRCAVRRFRFGARNLA